MCLPPAAAAVEYHVPKTPPSPKLPGWSFPAVESFPAARPFPAGGSETAGESETAAGGRDRAPRRAAALPRLCDIAFAAAAQPRRNRSGWSARRQGKSRNPGGRTWPPRRRRLGGTAALSVCLPAAAAGVEYHVPETPKLRPGNKGGAVAQSVTPRQPGSRSATIQPFHQARTNSHVSGPKSRNNAARISVSCTD